MGVYFFGDNNIIIPIFLFMARQKVKWISVEIAEEDSLHPYNNKPFPNFICQERYLAHSIVEVTKDESFFKTDENKKQLEYLLKNYLKKPVSFINENMVIIEEISLYGKSKPEDGYLYYLEDITSKKSLFCAFNELISLLKKKLKEKEVIVFYNGEKEKCVFDENNISNIISRMSNETHPINIIPYFKKTEGENIIIVPFKLIDN